jgi:hypothetical protein
MNRGTFVKTLPALALLVSTTLALGRAPNTGRMDFDAGWAELARRGAPPILLTKTPPQSGDNQEQGHHPRPGDSQIPG